MAHPNEALLHGMASAYSRGDMAAFVDCFTDDCTAFIPGKIYASGVHRGRGALVRLWFWTELEQGGSSTWSPQAIFADDKTGMALIEWRAEVGARTYEETEVLVVHFEKNGLISDLRLYVGDQYAFDSFYGKQPTTKP